MPPGSLAASDSRMSSPGTPDLEAYLGREKVEEEVLALGQVITSLINASYSFNSTLSAANPEGSIGVSSSFDCFGPGVLRPFST